jgi:hemoglobin
LIKTIFIMQTLFDKYGGVPAVTVIVRDFYKRVMKRPSLRRYFVDVKMQDLILHQVAFVSMAMGKTSGEYAGRNMREAHMGLKITESSFELAADLLRGSLEAAELEVDDIDSILCTVNQLKNQIVEQ